MQSKHETIAMHRFYLSVLCQPIRFTQWWALREGRGVEHASLVPFRMAKTRGYALLDALHIEKITE